jgi:adenylate cyclase
VDATTGYHLWATRYDRVVQDIFAVQEEIARRITRALAVRLTPEEAEYMGRPYTDNVEAWQYFVQGADFYRRFKKEDNAQARALFEQAIRLDDQFARAYALLAATHRQDWTLAWSPNPAASEKAAEDAAQRAVDLAGLEPEPKPSLPYALQQLAYVRLYQSRHQEAQEAAEEAVRRNPNYADGIAVLAQVLIYRGQTRYALDRMEIAKRLDPKYPAYYDYHVGQAYYVEGFLTGQNQHYVTAELQLREALKKNPNFRPARIYLAAVLWALDRQDEAKAEMTILIQKLGRPSSRDPAFRQHLQQVNPYEAPAITTRLIESWERAEP